MPSPTTLRKILSGTKQRIPVRDMAAWWTVNSLQQADGSNVGSWTDIIGGNVASNAGANKPTYDATKNNGRPAVHFNTASSQALSVTFSTTYTVPFTIFIAMDSFSAPAGYAFDGTTSGNRVALARDSSGVGTFDRKPFIFNGGSVIQSPSVSPDFTFITFGCVYDSNGILYRNGDLDALGALGTNSLSALKWGSRFSDTFYGDFWLTDFLVYPRTLAASEVKLLDNYFRKLYAR